MFQSYIPFYSLLLFPEKTLKVCINSIGHNPPHTVDCGFDVLATTVNSVNNEPLCDQADFNHYHHESYIILVFQTDLNGLIPWHQTRWYELVNLYNTSFTDFEVEPDFRTRYPCSSIIQ